jgi:hypothetical protein
VTNIAVMQPYLFPYLGYYQLVHHVSEFVFFDDVNFIKRGYVVRNHILCDGASRRFTLPVHRASQNRLIKDHIFLDDASRVTNLIEHAYRRAPHFSTVYPLICTVLNDPNRSVANITACSIRCVFAYLGLEKRFSFSSNISKSQLAKGEQKIIEICIAKRARQYTNAIGGKELYHADTFASRGIALQFIRMNDIYYSQLSPCYVPNLSIIDILMNCPKEQVRNLLDAYSIEMAPLLINRSPGGDSTGRGESISARNDWRDDPSKPVFGCMDR